MIMLQSNIMYQIGLKVIPRPVGTFSRTCPVLGDILSPLPYNYRANRRSKTGKAAIESQQRKDSNAYLK